MEWMEAVYKRFLLERVLIEGETTLKTAVGIAADPDDVRKDFEEALQEMPQIAAAIDAGFKG